MYIYIYIYTYIYMCVYIYIYIYTPNADMGEGFETISFKPHILKHHIPEHPTCVVCGADCNGRCWNGEQLKDQCLNCRGMLFDLSCSALVCHCCSCCYTQYPY